MTVAADCSVVGRKSVFIEVMTGTWFVALAKMKKYDAASNATAVMLPPTIAGACREESHLRIAAAVPLAEMERVSREVSHVRSFRRPAAAIDGLEVSAAAGSGFIRLKS